MSRTEEHRVSPQEDVPLDIDQDGNCAKVRGPGETLTPRYFPGRRPTQGQKKLFGGGPPFRETRHRRLAAVLFFEQSLEFFFSDHFDFQQPSRDLVNRPFLPFSYGYP